MENKDSCSIFQNIIHYSNKVDLGIRVCLSGNFCLRNLDCRKIDFTQRKTTYLFLNTPSSEIETDEKKMRLAEKYAINEKSIIFTKLLWNLVKIINSWVGKIAWISAWLGQKKKFLLSLYSLYVRTCSSKSNNRDIFVSKSYFK